MFDETRADNQETHRQHERESSRGFELRAILGHQRLLNVPVGWTHHQETPNTKAAWQTKQIGDGASVAIKRQGVARTFRQDIASKTIPLRGTKASSKG